MQIDRGHAEVAVSELALDEIERYALAHELDRVCVTQLVRGEASSHTGARGTPAQRRPSGRGIPGPPLGPPVDDAEQRPDRHVLAHEQPRLELFETPVVHVDLASAPALTARTSTEPRRRSRSSSLRSSSASQPRSRWTPSRLLAKHNVPISPPRASSNAAVWVRLWMSTPTINR
jgi:hypothetical protein